MKTMCRRNNMNSTQRFGARAQTSFSTILLAVLTVFVMSGLHASAQVNYVSWDFNPTLGGGSYAGSQANMDAVRTTALTSPTIVGITLGTVTAVTANTFHRTTGWPTATSANSSVYVEYSVSLASGQTFPDATLTLAMTVNTSSATTAAKKMQVTYGYGTSPTFANAGAVQTIGTANSSPSVTIPAPGNTTTTKLTIRILCYDSGTGSGNVRIITSALTGSAPLTGGATPSITGAATATAFTTTYGTASTKQDFSVSGANLTANITATAGTGFEVASDGTTFGATATFTQSGGSASGTVSVRLKANAAVSGSYNSVNAVVLSSTGATSVNITTASSGNAVTAKALSITASAQSKTYGATLSLGTSAFTSSGLANSETIGSVTLSATGGLTAASPAITYTITPSAATGGTFTAGNYTITYNTGVLTVNPKALTITANGVTKVYGDTLSSPVTGSTAFTPSGLANSETVGSVTITYGAGKDAGDAAQVYVGSVVPSAATGGTFGATNYSITYVAGDLTVTADPTITLSGSLTAVNTTYGTPSTSPASFSVSGVFLSGDLSVAPPSGYEVSLSSGSGYTTSLTIPASGTLSATTVYVRLAATTGYNGGAAYTGNVMVSGGGAASKTIATVGSTVTRAALTITGLSGADKEYNGNTTATLSGTAAYSGLQNGESFSVTGTPTATFATAAAGTGKTITVTGYTAPSANYTLTQPTGLTASITAKALTVTANNVNKKEGTALTSPVTGSTAFTSSGLVGAETIGSVTITYGTGAAANATPATYTGSVTPSAATNGTFAATNYSITYVSGDIIVSPASTYTWVATSGSAAWTTAASWSPSRTTPDTSDILVFNGGGSSTATAVPTQTIGKLQVSGNTAISLQSAGAVTLTISSATTDALTIASGSTLTNNSANTLSIVVATGAKGSISGTVSFSAGASTLTAADASGITFNSGAVFTQDTGSSGNIFSSSGTANTIVFASGSTFVQKAGSNPFGLGQPASKVVFQTGSLFSVQQNAAPSLSGRTYANLEINATGFAQSGTGTGGLTVDDIAIVTGTLNANLTAVPILIKGNISVANGQTLTFTPAAAGAVIFSGTVDQTVSGTGTLSFGANSTASITNGSTVVLQKDATFSGSLIVRSGGTLKGTGTATGAVVVNSGGTLAPGTSVGTLTLAGAPTLAGTVTMEADKTSSITSADKIVRSGGSLAYGGTLTVTKTGPDSLTGGEVFDLFDATGFGGSFTTINLPTLDAGLNWRTDTLVTDGSIKVNRSPVAANVALGVPAGEAASLLIIGGKSAPTDADGDTLTITGVTQGANGTVTFTSTNVTYTSTSAASSDSFTYTVSDGFGGTAIGTVAVTLTSGGGSFNQLSATQIEGGALRFTYLGIPGTNYLLEVTHSLSGEVSWSPLQTNAANGTGSIIFTNTPSLAPTNDFYRTRYVP